MAIPKKKKKNAVQRWNDYAIRWPKTTIVCPPVRRPVSRERFVSEWAPCAVGMRSDPAEISPRAATRTGICLVQPHVPRTSTTGRWVAELSIIARVPRFLAAFENLSGLITFWTLVAESSKCKNRFEKWITIVYQYEWNCMYTCNYKFYKCNYK